MAGKNRMSGWLRRRTDSASGSARPAWDSRTARGARPPVPDPRRDPLVTAAARAGFPVAPAAYPQGFGCSCDRIGCPAPGMHPVSPAWHSQASTDPQRVAGWLARDPLANFVTATGIDHDVLDVPAEAGRIALERLTADGATLGPVAAYGEGGASPAEPGGRYLFFTATRGTPADEDEWWPCALDSHPETEDERPGIRWHCRGSYVLLPPSRLPSGATVAWLPDHGPDLPLPDPLPVLDILTDACASYGLRP